MAESKMKVVRDQAKDLAEALAVLREELSKSGLSKDEIGGILQAYAGRPQVELVKPLEVWSDHDLEDEAERRNLSWLSVESDEDLLDEVERRNLMGAKSDLSEEEFEREAHKRGFRQTLAEFPLEEIRRYLEVQSHQSHSGHQQGHQNHQGHSGSGMGHGLGMGHNGSRRRKKNRKNRRPGMPPQANG